LQQISGYVSVLRDCITWLAHINLSPERISPCENKIATKWIWGVSESQIKDQKCREFLVYLHHLTHIRVNIPLGALVSGDMNLLPPEFLQWRSSTPQSPGLDVVTLQNKLDMIADRCASPFGSFPIGQLMHAIAPNL
jgi:hypothetical protein